ncbi:MAG: DUF362 domain-containing protein, partial [Myxococcales bacterium]|nr:DUF362 domain-containing protein [Myxococcales bacterium]
YHDSFWYPMKAQQQVEAVMASDWGRLFQNWENLTPDERGFTDVGSLAPELKRSGMKAFAKSIPLIGGAIMEAPEFARSKMKRSAAESH